MIFTLDAPKGCGLRHDRRLRKLTITAENVRDQEMLYEIAGQIKIYEGKEQGGNEP